MRSWLLHFCISQLATGRVGLRYKLALWLDDLLEGF